MKYVKKINEYMDDYYSTDDEQNVKPTSKLKTLKDFGPDDWSDYEFFEYVLETYINGNFSQLKEMFKKLRDNDEWDEWIDFWKNYPDDKLRLEIAEHF